MNSFGFYDVYYSKKRNESYIVQKGDSLYKIAQKYGVTVEELMEANKLESTVIYPNQVIVIPVKVNNGGMYFQEYVIEPNDTLEMISQKLNVSTDLIGRYNDLTKLVLVENQILKIPYSYKTYVIMEDDTLETILTKTNMTAEDLIKANADKWLAPGTVIYVK